MQEHIYKMDLKDRSNFSQAWEKAREWNYDRDEEAKIPIGIFYQNRQLTWDEKWPQLNKPWYRKQRKIDWTEVIKNWK